MNRELKLKKHKLVSKNTKPGRQYLHNPVYVDPLVYCLLLADDWENEPDGPGTVIPLDSIVSWLNTDVLKSLRFLAIGLILIDSNVEARVSEPALSPLLKFSALDRFIAVISPESQQRNGFVDLFDPYSIRLRTPPLLAPGEEDSMFAFHLADEVRFAQSNHTGGDASFTRLTANFNCQVATTGLQRLKK